jgi:hypothetical protein
MAERLVIAELVVDEKGVVTAINDSTEKIRLLGKQTKETADVVTERMFSMRHAVTAFLGTFTIAGGVYALKGFVEDAIRANKEFATLSVSAEHFQKSMAGAAGHIFAINESVPGMISWLDRFSNFLDKASKLHAQLDAGGIPMGGGPGEMFGPPAPPGYGNAGYDPDHPAAGFIGPPGPAGYGNRSDQMYINGRLANLTKATRIDDGDLQAMSHAWPEIPDAEALDRWNAALDLQERQNEYWEKSGEIIKDLTERYQQYGSVASAAGDAVAAAAQSGILSQSAAARASALIIAGESTIRGMFELAAAAASLAAYDYRGAVLHKIASGLYFATAAFKGAGAFGAGGGGGSAADRGLIANRFSPANQAAAGPQITVIVQGDVVGKDAWIRDLADQIGKAVQDQSGMKFSPAGA